MKFTVQYIPLNKIKNCPRTSVTDRMNKLKMLMLDCMHLLVVRKNHSDDSYSLLYGISHLDYLKKHTEKIYVPCIVDEHKEKGLKGWISRIRANHALKYAMPWNFSSWSIFRSFLRQEPRFNRLSPAQKLKVIFLAIRYKKTTIHSMRKKVDRLAKE